MAIRTTPRMLWNRLMGHTVIDPRTGCFIYTGPTKSRDGSTLYGKISMRLRGRLNPTGVATHSLSGTTFIRALRDGFEWSHTCHRSLCWNPEHLKQEKHTTNMRHVSRRRKEGCYA